MASSMWLSSATTKHIANLARHWFAHVAGILPLWFRLSLPWALIEAWFSGAGWAHKLLPFLVSPLSAGLYAAGYIALRTRPPIPLRLLKRTDTALLACAAVGAGLVTHSPVAAAGLFALAWLDNWHHQAPESHPNEGMIPPAPPFQAPVVGPATAGYRSYDISHTGIDIGVPEGTPVLAPADGVVVQAGPLGQWGYAVTVEHEQGWSTFFAHLAEVAVHRNMRVTAGCLVARSGSSGISTGPHVHVELRYQGLPVNPAVLIRGHNE